MRTSGSADTCCATRASTRSRSRAAPRRPKVSTNNWSGGVPSAIRAATDSTSVVVLPVPGPPSTSRAPARCAVTARCASSSATGAVVGVGARSSR